MNTRLSLAPTLTRFLRLLLIGLCAVLVASCGGGDDDDSPPSTAPEITRQPTDVSVTAGQSATFFVDAVGGGLSYQWQRDGVDIPGETSSVYVLGTADVDDDDAHFSVVVSNALGVVSSNDGVLTVDVPVPVLTVTQQPADASVAAGSPVTFTVAATCSSGTLDIQWQRNNGSNGAFADIAGATAATLNLTPGSADDGARFRAALDCGGQAGTVSDAATLGVVAAASLHVDLLPLSGLRVQGTVNGVGPVVQNADGSITFANANTVKHLSADLQSITRFAGSGSQGIVDGTGAAAAFSQLSGAVADASGNVYVLDNSALRRIAADGTVTTLAGSGNGGSNDGTGAAAHFASPRGIALGPDGDLYVADNQAHNIRRVTPAGVVTTYAGTGVQGYAEGPAGTAQFNAPWGIAVAANGDVLVGDYGNKRIRRIARNGNGAGNVTTLAGTGLAGTAVDGAGLSVPLEQAIGMVVRGNVLTVLQGVGVVRQIDLATGAVTTLAGTYAATPYGYADGARGQALFTGQGGIAALADGRFLVGDGSALRLIAASGDVRTIAVSGSDQSFDAEGGMLAQRPFSFASNTAQTLTADASGNVVVASQGLVRRVGPTGTVSLVAGLAGGIRGMVDGVGSSAQFSAVGSGIAAAPDGTLYVSDADSLRRIDAGGNTTLLAGYRVVALDGSGNPPYGAVDGDAATARFQNQLQLAVGPDGLLYVADTANCAIRRVDAAGNTATWAGVLGSCSSVDGARAASRWRAPGSMAFAPDGSLYVVDGGTLRKVSADGASVSTVSTANTWRLVKVDGAGNVFLSAADGLYEMAAGSNAANRLVAGGTNDALVTGTSPHLGRIDALAVLAPGRLAMISGYQLVTVTLP